MGRSIPMTRGMTKEPGDDRAVADVVRASTEATMIGWESPWGTVGYKPIRFAMPIRYLQTDPLPGFFRSWKRGIWQNG